jgi:hypothetical protein
MRAGGEEWESGGQWRLRLIGKPDDPTCIVDVTRKGRGGAAIAYRLDDALFHSRSWLFKRQYQL